MHYKPHMRMRALQRLAADTLTEQEDAALVLQHPGLHRLAPPGLPAHGSRTNVRTMDRWMRHFSVGRGLVTNTRVVVTHIGSRIMAVGILDVPVVPISVDIL